MTHQPWLARIDIAHSMTWQQQTCRLILHHKIVPEVVTETDHNG